jgi:hypothetical protein
MSERHPVKDSQYIKAIRDIHSFYQEVSLKNKNNRPLIPHTAIVAHVCAAFKISESSVGATLKEFKTCRSPRKKNAPNRHD